MSVRRCGTLRLEVDRYQGDTFVELANVVVRQQNSPAGAYRCARRRWQRITTIESREKER